MLPLSISFQKKNLVVLLVVFFFFKETSSLSFGNFCFVKVLNTVYLKVLLICFR